MARTLALLALCLLAAPAATADEPAAEGDEGQDPSGFEPLRGPDNMPLACVGYSHNANWPLPDPGHMGFVYVQSYDGSLVCRGYDGESFGFWLPLIICGGTSENRCEE